VYELCVLIENQQVSICDSYLHRAALIRHLFTRVIPLPLPLNHQNRGGWCFWASADGVLLYAQQVELLRLLNKLAEVYSAVSLSLASTNTLDASRMLVMACMTCLADAIVRIHAADTPSVVSQHIGGRNANTGGAFGINVFEQFALESESSLYTSAVLAAARCQVLDYFQSVRTTLKEHRIIFDFSSSHTLSSGDMELVKNLCLATGFAHDRSRSMAAQHITGDLPQLLLRFPELEAFRNIALHWSVLLTANRADLPETRPWLAADAQLQWSVRDECYCVRAFGKQLASTKVHAKSEGMLGRLKDVISGSGKRMPSAADPRSLLGESKVVTEEDILYIRHLPELGGLSASSAELLLQVRTHAIYHCISRVYLHQNDRFGFESTYYVVINEILVVLAVLDRSVPADPTGDAVFQRSDSLQSPGIEPAAGDCGRCAVRTRRLQARGASQSASRRAIEHSFRYSVRSVVKRAISKSEIHPEKHP